MHAEPAMRGMVAKERYPVHRVDLLRDLKVHLQKLDSNTPDGNCRGCVVKSFPNT